jgi:hypothetical protein
MKNDFVRNPQAITVLPWKRSSARIAERLFPKTQESVMVAGQKSFAARAGASGDASLGKKKGPAAPNIFT